MLVLFNICIGNEYIYSVLYVFIESKLCGNACILSIVHYNDDNIIITQSGRPGKTFRRDRLLHFCDTLYEIVQVFRDNVGRQGAKFREERASDNVIFTSEITYGY